jgi:hypothetical protein
MTERRLKLAAAALFGFAAGVVFSIAVAFLATSEELVT